MSFSTKSTLLFLSLFAIEQVSSASLYGYFFQQQPSRVNVYLRDQATSPINLPVELSENYIPSLDQDGFIQESNESEQPEQSEDVSFYESLKTFGQFEHPQYNFDEELVPQIKAARLRNPRYSEPTAQDYAGVFSSLSRTLMVDELIEFANSLILPEAEAESVGESDGESSLGLISEAESDLSDDDGYAVIASNINDNVKEDVKDEDTVIVSNINDESTIISDISDETTIISNFNDEYDLSG